MARDVPPRTDESESLKVAAVHSAARLAPPGAYPRCTPPFRAPHHTFSMRGLTCGGPLPALARRGSRANGVLFSRRTARTAAPPHDATRESLEHSGTVTARAAHAVALSAVVS